MFAVTRLRATGEDGAALEAAVGPLLEALGAMPGVRSGDFGRAADDPTLWALVTRFSSSSKFRIRPGSIVNRVSTVVR